MSRALLSLAVALLLSWAGSSPAQSIRLDAFAAKATPFRSVIALPAFENTTNAVWETVRRTIADGNAALQRIGALPRSGVTFSNTVLALDDLDWSLRCADDRLSLIKETSTSAEVREATADALKELEKWMVGIDYREDVYAALKAYADTRPALEGAEAKLLSETLRDYRRAGLALPKPQRDEVEKQRKELTRLVTDYDSNITKAHKTVLFTRDELEGVPASFLDEVKTTNGQYAVMANVTWHYLMVMDNARREDTRKKLLFEYDNLAREQNIPLLEKILPLRDDIAHKLGYATWADYQTEVKMAKTAATAMDFLDWLKTGLQPKFDAELAEFRRLKIQETGDTNAVIHVYDWRYYASRLKKEKYNVDAEQLRDFFPYQRVLEGMFAIYQGIFGLKFERVEPPFKWVDDLRLYAVSDAGSGEPLGLFYLDMFPREGKYNHFAVFGITEGKRLGNGLYQRPVCALVCNFPAPSKDRPSLLSHDDVETIFHEFGHAMHTILTRAPYSRFSGTSVPGDFVEAPSQMLENWAWDKTVLDSFAADYRDPSKKIPGEILARLKEARLSTEATRYRRQLSFGLTDLSLHTRIHDTNAVEAVPLSNDVLSRVFLPSIPGTAFVAYFGHLMHYDAGYYGYAWADAIAADLATVFERSPKGYFDEAAGRRLRTEIYEPGDSRDAGVSIEKFLGRPRSIEPFLERIGVRKAAPVSKP